LHLTATFGGGFDAISAALTEWVIDSTPGDEGEIRVLSQQAGRGRRILVAGIAATLLLAACSDDTNGAADGTGDEVPDDEPAIVDEEPEALRILVTNDDGIDAPGIDSVVEGLKTLPDVELVIVAPAEDQSATGDQTSDVPPEAEEATTTSGEAGIAVDGLPADAVVHAFEEVFTDDDEIPHLVVSGNNFGPNLGFISYISGTVGAARTAARSGVPSLAVSQGLGSPADFEAAVPFMLDWVEQHRDALLAGDVATDTVASLNVPTCEEGELRGLEDDLDLAFEAGDRSVIGPSDCTSTETDLEDDLDAFLHGFATLTEVPVEEPVDD
jgi:5'-nucleotidase